MNKQNLMKRGGVIVILFAVMLTFTGCLSFNKKAEVNQPKAENNAENNFVDSTEGNNSQNKTNNQEENNNITENETQVIRKIKNVEIILDASGSMKGIMKSGKTKMTAAREAIGKLLNGLDDDSIRLATRAYGHQSVVAEHNCEDTELLSSLSIIDKNAVMNKINSLSPRGYTPIGYSLQKAGKDFPASKEGVSNVIILVSDGEETCDGDPCEVAKNLKKSGVETTIHAIGFGVDKIAKEQLQCIADATGGKYFDAENADELAEVLLEAVNNELKYGRLTIQTFDEDDSPMPISVFIRNQQTGKIVKNALNKLDGHGSGNDGIYSYLYEPGKYKIDIGNILVRENINLEAGEEKVFKIHLSSLELTTKSKEVIFKIKTINDSLVDAQTVKSGKTWTKKLPAGKYKIKKEMVDGELVKDEYQLFTVKRGENMQIEL